MKPGKNLKAIAAILKKHEAELHKMYGIKKIGVFGSFARGEAGRESDLDLLVEFAEDIDMGLLRFVEVERYLSHLLGRKVDLVEKKVLRPYIGRHILEEVIYP